MSLETHLSCLAALPLVGASYSRKNEELTCECPACGSLMDIIQPSMVCRSRGCDFGRGGSLDYLAYKLGGYREALQLAGTIIPGLKEGDFEDTDWLYRRRKILEFFMDLEGNSPNSDSERVNLRIQFMASGVSPDAFQSSVLFATGAEARTLQLLLLEYGIIPPSILGNQPVMLIPYWGHYHALGRLLIITQNFRQQKEIKIEAFRQSWFGLAQKRSTCQAVDVFPTYVDTIASGHHFSSNITDRFPSHLVIDTLCDEPGFLPEDLIFHGHGEAWFYSLPIWSLLGDLSEFGYYEEGKGFMDLDGLLTHLLFTSVHGNVSRFMDLCSATRIPVAERSRLLLQAEQVLDRSAMTKLRRIMSRRLLTRDAKRALYECAEGYELETAGVTDRLSNFTLTLKATVGFPAVAEMNYQGTVAVGPVEFPFDLSNKHFEKPAKLEAMLQHVQFSRAGHVVSEEAVKVRNANGFKHVLEWLRLETSEVVRKKGYRNLGWTRRCDKFITPLVLVDPMGIQDGITYYPDETGEHLGYDSSLECLPPPDSHALPPELAELVSGMISQLVRFYHVQQVRPIPIRNTKESRDLGLRLFRGLGQSELIRFSNNYERNLGLNKGMPFLMSFSTEQQAQKAKTAGLYLSDSGIDLKIFKQDDIDVAAGILGYLVAEIPRRLLSGDPVFFREARSVKPHAAMAVEGANLIRNDFWPDWPKAGTRWASVDLLLHTYEHRLAEVVSVDNEDIIIKPAAWETIGVDPVDLTLEKGLLCNKVVMEEAGLRVDRFSFYQVLSDYYGEVPKIMGALPPLPAAL